MLAAEAAPPTFVRLAGHPLRWRLLRELAVSDRRVRELSAEVAEPQNLVSYHLRLLRDGGLVRATRSSFDGREAYYHLDLDRCAEALSASGAALHPALRRQAATGAPVAPEAPPKPVAVLFICTGNSARSPIAEALLRQRAGDWVTAASAGTQPKPELHPAALGVLRESFGIDCSAQRPRHVNALAGQAFDFVITLCDRAREACPEFPHHPRQLHWSVPDPAMEGGDDAFERAAADIEARVRHLIPVLALYAQEVEP
ncbi:MAG: ArsR family transcriptional regulator [Hyphomicrobiales bacterium]